MAKAKILVVDDEKLIRWSLKQNLEKENYEVFTASTGEEAMDLFNQELPDLILQDIKLPGKSGLEILENVKKLREESLVIMMTAYGDIQTSVKAMRLGAYDFVEKPFDFDKLKLTVAKALETVNLKKEVGYFRKLYFEGLETNIIGESTKIKSMMDEINQIAQAGVSTVLVTGESGTGKELVARRIHQIMHQDRYAPFIQVNCAALPETLLETELFGYAKGAFTDAKTRKAGLFELADGGSILLDEIGDMKMDLQSKLLRVLEERAVRRVGESREVPVNVLVIATTNRELDQEVERGELRLDLFYRLNTFRLAIAPLRERKEDVLLLSEYFLSRFCEKNNKRTIKGSSPEAIRLLTSYPWPGNVRELKNVIERIVVLKETEWVQPEHLPAEIMHASEKKDDQVIGRFVLPDTGISLETLEKDLILQALEKAKNNKTLAAKLLGISYDTLRYQIKKIGLE